MRRPTGRRATLTLAAFARSPKPAVAVTPFPDTIGSGFAGDIGQHVLGLMKGAAQWLVAWVFLMGLLGLIVVTCNAITQ